MPLSDIATNATSERHFRTRTGITCLIRSPTVMRLVREWSAQQAVILAIRRKKGGSNKMSHLLLLRLARETGGAVKFHLFTVTDDYLRVAACLSFNLPAATIRSESRRSTGHAINNVIRR